MPAQSIRTALFTFLVAGLPAGAIAAPPAVLDRVPADAQVVITVRQVEDFLADIDQLNATLGDKANPGMAFATAMVRGMPGVNLDGSAAFIFTLPQDPEEDEPTLVALLPVSDFAALTQGRAADNGLVRLALPDQELFARDVGDGLAVVSDDPDAARAFDAAKGRLNAHTGRIGEAGGAVLSDAEVSVIANGNALRPFLNMGVEGFKQQGAMVAMMGGEQAAAGFNATASVVEAVVRDLSAGVFGLTMSEAGMAYDAAFQFTEGSPSASFFEKSGSTAGLFEHLPAQRYLFAMALDTSSPTAAKLGKAFTQFASAVNGAQNATGQLSLEDLHRLTKGMSFVMGTPPSLMGGGLFTNTTQFIKTDNPDAYLKAVTDAMKAADGQQVEGVKMDATVTPGAITIDGTSLTAYGLSMTMDPAAMQQMGGMPGMDPTIITQMIFGPTGGPSGYLAKVDGGAVQTLSQAPEFTRRALAAAKGGKGLGADARFGRVRNQLQNDRIAEVFVGVDEILNTVGPTLMMFGAIPEFEPVKALDPIAVGLASRSGGVHARFVMPAETFKAISEMMPETAGTDWDDDDDHGFDF